VVIITELHVRGSVYRAAAYGLEPATFRKMLRSNLPPGLFNLLARLRGSPEVSNEQDIDYVEWYSGVENVRAAMAARNLTAVGYDIENDSLNQNILKAEGLLTMLQWIRRQRPGAGNHWGTVCSTWVWVPDS